MIIFRFLKDDAVVANAEAQQTVEFATERFHFANTGRGVTMNGAENTECRTLFDGPDLWRDVGMKADFFHRTLTCPRVRGLGPW